MVKELGKGQPLLVIVRVRAWPRPIVVVVDTVAGLPSPWLCQWEQDPSQDGDDRNHHQQLD
jgi:hypothetical protein